MRELGRRFALAIGATNDEDLAKVLTNKALAQFGDALLNFAYSLALTETTGEPKGKRVPDKVLAEAAVRAGLRKKLPRRIGRGEIANGLEALLGYSWLRRHLSLDEILECLKAETFTPADNFAKLAELALSRLRT